MKFTVEFAHQNKRLVELISGNFYVTWDKLYALPTEDTHHIRCLMTCTIFHNDMAWSGIAIKHPKDEDNGFVARKVAFSKALDQYLQYVEHGLGKGYSIDHKIFKKIFWDALLNHPHKSLILG